MECLTDARSTLTRNAFRTLNSVVRPAVRSGAGNPPPVGVGAVVLEVNGRVSGEPREVPLLANRIGDTVTVSTVRDDSQWLRNVEADPNVVVNLYGERREGTANVRRGPLNVVSITLAAS